MIEPLPLLARGDDEAIKIIVGVIVAIVWGIISLVAAVNKKVKEQQRRQQYNQMPPGVPTMPSGGAGPVIFSEPTPPPLPRQRSKRRKQRQEQMVPSDEVVEVAHVPLASSPPIEGQAARASAAQQAAPEASRVARLLRRPDSLRAAIILNEVLSPPKALRDE